MNNSCEPPLDYTRLIPYIQVIFLIGLYIVDSRKNGESMVFRKVLGKRTFLKRGDKVFLLPA